MSFTIKTLAAIFKWLGKDRLFLLTEISPGWSDPVDCHHMYSVSPVEKQIAGIRALTWPRTAWHPKDCSLWLQDLCLLLCWAIQLTVVQSGLILNKWHSINCCIKKWCLSVGCALPRCSCLYGHYHHWKSFHYQYR